MHKFNTTSSKSLRLMMTLYHKLKSMQDLSKFYRFNYQLKWEKQDQNAYINFPQTFDEIDLLPSFIRDD